MASKIFLPEQKTYGCILTSIGELCVFYISSANQSDLNKSLGKKIKDCSPEKFVREFSRILNSHSQDTFAIQKTVYLMGNTNLGQLCFQMRT